VRQKDLARLADVAGAVLVDSDEMSMPPGRII
jgi:hypothetical protein